MSVVRGRAPDAGIYPSPLSELSTLSGHKRVAVTEVSDLFSPPLKRLSTPTRLRDRMFLAAQSLTALRNSPPALGISAHPPNISLAASSPSLTSSGSAPPSEPLHPSAGKKSYKAPTKSRSATQLVLVDEISHADAHVDIRTSASCEVAGSTMPPPVP